MNPIFELGKIILLNGVPRSGKSSIASVIQDTFDGVWLNLGVDNYMKAIPQRYQPGIGLRPGGERPDIESMILIMYQALYQSIAAHSRLGLNVVADLGHHDCYSKPLHILETCARILQGLPAMLVGVRCSPEENMRRRIETWGMGYAQDGSIPKPVLLWDQSVHTPGIYDLEVDTTTHTSEACAALISKRLNDGQPFTALEQLARCQI